MVEPFVPGLRRQVSPPRRKLLTLSSTPLIVNALSMTQMRHTRKTLSSLLGSQPGNRWGIARSTCEYRGTKAAADMFVLEPVKGGLLV